MVKLQKQKSLLKPQQLVQLLRIIDLKKLFGAEYPSWFNGIETASPSGKFCKPIPIAREIAAPNVASGIPNDAAPNATPIAIPLEYYV